MSWEPATSERVDYRERVYARYASTIKGYPREFDRSVAERWARAFRRYLRGWLPADRTARIADLACGDGKLLYMLRQAGYSEILGVDISPEQTALARQVHDDVVQSDVLEFLAARKGEFDLLVGLDIVEHFSKEEAFRFLELAHRALRPGGRLILNTPNAASPFFGSRRYGDFTHEIAFSPLCITGVFRLFGFERIETRELGPYPHGLLSSVRSVLWKLLRIAVLCYNFVETGKAGDGPCTRDFLVSGLRKLSP